MTKIAGSGSISHAWIRGSGSTPKGHGSGTLLLTVKARAVDPHRFDVDPEPDPDPAKNLDADPDPDPDPGGGRRSAKNVHPPWQNPRYAPACWYRYPLFNFNTLKVHKFYV